MPDRRLKIKDEPARRQSYRMSGRLMWVVLIVWAILFVLIRTAFKFEGNPALIFLLMLVLFFAVLFFVRVGVLRMHNWWGQTRPGFIRFLATLLPTRRR